MKNNTLLLLAMLIVACVPITACAPRIEYRNIGVPLYLTEMPDKVAINYQTATSKDVALFIIDQNADVMMCRQRLNTIQEHYGSKN